MLASQLLAMTDRTAGTYVEGTLAAERYRAFVPHPLPPDPAVAIGSEILMLIESANRALGRTRWSGVAVSRPGLVYLLLRSEGGTAFEPNEGTQSSLSDLLLFEDEEVPGVPLDDVQEVSCYVAAMNYGLERLRWRFSLVAPTATGNSREAVEQWARRRKRSGRVQAAPKLDWRKPAESRHVRPAPARPSHAMFGRVRAFPPRRAAVRPVAGEGCYGACSIRNDPPVPGRQWSLGPIAHHSAALCRRCDGSANSLSQLVFQSQSRRILPATSTRTRKSRLGRFGSSFSCRA